MNYLNVLILSICGIIFSVFLLLDKTKRDYKGVLLGVICLSLTFLYMLDFPVFLKGGIQEESRIVRLAQGGYRFPITNIITENGEKYWGSRDLYRSNITKGEKYAIYYLPRTKSLLKIKSLGEPNNQNPYGTIYNYKDDYWISTLIVFTFGVIIIAKNIRRPIRRK